jgi:STE24 endopeptidase
VTPVEDQSLVDRLKTIAQGTGLTVSNVSRFSMSKETKKANAFLSGMGSTKHVMLGDTLVDAFTQEEIEAVFAHEVGHYVHGHIVKGIVMSTIVTLLSFFVCNLVLTSLAPALGYASFTAPAALPLFFLVLGVFSFLIGPFEKAVSRYFERQSDWYSLERMQNVPAHKAAFKRLAELNKAELKPAKWKVLLFHTHPPINERLAMADRFAELNKA